MDSKVKLYLERAENEFRLAKAMFNLSGIEEIKVQLEANPKDTFYSAVISHCYYAVFYCAKASLLIKGVETKAPEVHKKTLEEFKRIFVDTGKLDVELLKIYRKMIVRADELLGILKHEKWKRGHFTYHTIAQANIEPAKESIENAKKFLINIKEVIKK
ncbi:MAG: HEPN domain-containing protein [Nanoarchaeota archaeon]|nr:HEPN domain-containing protein [Nanoarchaeota archaeon]